MDDFASADTLSTDETIAGMDDFASADALSTDETISETDDFAAPDSLGADDISATESISDDQNLFDTPVDNAMAPADDFAPADALADMSAFDEPAATDDLGSTDGLVADDSFAAPDQEALTGADINFEDSGSAQDSEPVAAGNALSFTGLYDKETEMGESASHEDGETKKKIKIPMFVCIGCAAICILVTILLLIFLPTKYELKSNVTVTETSAGPEAIAAKENEIIIIKDGDKVTPVNNTVNRKGVSYKIKWGDTLWDIADTYYKNPWKYKKIASYNGIKNPDHIISGTVITIPAE
ncbi:MAG: LysM peptidoglycan-binding domain-containing protein [Treponema sp.]|nr:LysM peptidoglycan-binding domain-containing protein [Treponema sp.]